MGYGETDGDEPAARRPLPRADRVWRHPTEVALEAREAAAARRRRRRHRTGTTILGLAGAAALLWLVRTGDTDVSVSADLVRVDREAGDDATSVTTTLAVLFDAETTPDDMILVRDAESAETLAAALAIGDGHVITSAQAIDDARSVLITLGGSVGTGVVIGHDEATDVAVIRVGDLPLPSIPPGGAVTSGDIVTITLDNGDAHHQTVVESASATARRDGTPIVGVVELDGRIGEIAPGSPALGADGTVVGVTAATADTAPAALVAIDVARSVADDIIENGTALHPWIGVTARTNHGDPAGSLITAVEADGPAERGGIRAGDVVVAVGRSDVDSMEAMVAALREYDPGTTVAVVVIRDGEPVTCVVELDSHLDRAAP